MKVQAVRKVSYGVKADMPSITFEGYWLTELLQVVPGDSVFVTYAPGQVTFGTGGHSGRLPQRQPKSLVSAGRHFVRFS